jgi:hypothetical protein
MVIKLREVCVGKKSNLVAAINFYKYKAERKENAKGRENNFRVGGISHAEALRTQKRKWLLRATAFYPTQRR